MLQACTHYIEARDWDSPVTDLLIAHDASRVLGRPLVVYVDGDRWGDERWMASGGHGALDGRVYRPEDAAAHGMPAVIIHWHANHYRSVIPKYPPFAQHVRALPLGGVARRMGSRGKSLGDSNDAQFGRLGHDVGIFSNPARFCAEIVVQTASANLTTSLTPWNAPPALHRKDLCVFFMLVGTTRQSLDNSPTDQKSMPDALYRGEWLRVVALASWKRLDACVRIMIYFRLSAPANVRERRKQIQDTKANFGRTFRTRDVCHRKPTLIVEEALGVLNETLYIRFASTISGSA